MPTSIRSIKFWINAFIPKDISGYTETVIAGLHAGKTMVPDPGTPHLKFDLDLCQFLGPLPIVQPHQPCGTIIGWGDCYLTDQRSFDNSIHAQSRMHSEFTVEFAATGPVLSQWHNCDMTTRLDCTDGTDKCHARSKTSRMNFSILQVKKSTKRTKVVVVEMKCAASNPCSTPSKFLGDIDYNGVITVDSIGRSIEIDGVIDQFPAFEAYATINGGAGVTLFRLPPTGGKTAMNLPGPANRKVKYKLEDRAGAGIFDTLTKL